MGQPVLSLLFGSLIGFTLGLLGGGGSILTVPILVYVIGQDVHAATGTSLAIVGTSALLGAIAHGRRGNVRLKGGMAFGIISMLAAQPGVWLNRLVAGKVILLLFGCLMFVVGTRMVRRKTPPRPPDGAGGGLGTYAPKEWAQLLGLGGVVGLLTGFFGIGGGFLIVPALVLAGRFPAHDAVGTSLLIIAMTSASGLLGYLRFGAVDLGVVGMFVLGGAAGILLGTALAGLMPERTLARAFGWFIILVAVYVVFQNAGFRA
ncbi:MAG TPA: sulfite exporter TauE/SafE family protein [Candidatus Methylomirabilis sp.]|jgi:uncharacterized membrane protein YfcA